MVPHCQLLVRRNAQRSVTPTSIHGPLSPPKAKPASPSPTSRTKTAALAVKGDDRLPPPGTIITREYKGGTLQVKMLPAGFEFEGEVYKSLSAVAKAITGQHCNGYHFFRLGKETPR